MKTHFRIVLAALGAALVAACSSTVPQSLVSARDAYREAASGPANEVAPAELKDAEQALDRAEKSWRDDGASRETRDLAYIAERRSEIAAVIAQRRIAEKDKEMYEKQRIEVSDNLREQTLEELGDKQKQLEREADKVARERQARIEADKKRGEAEKKQGEAEKKQGQAEDEAAKAKAEAAAARAALARWAQLVENERGLVITLSQGVLFATGKSEVLPEASARLMAVGAYLGFSPGRRIVVEGHTDSNGSDAFNQTLSQARADAVRAYLIGQGVAPDRIRAVGYGESRPIATNATNEGRTTNRRVEIVLEPLPVIMVP